MPPLYVEAGFIPFYSVSLREQGAEAHNTNRHASIAVEVASNRMNCKLKGISLRQPAVSASLLDIK